MTLHDRPQLWAWAAIATAVGFVMRVALRHLRAAYESSPLYDRP